jgi:hypothetical protein
LEAFAPFVALRIAEDEFAPAHPMVGRDSTLEEAMAELGQFAKKRRLRALWLVHGGAVPAFPSGMSPRVERTMDLKTGPFTRRKIDRIIGPIFQGKGAILVLY